MLGRVPEAVLETVFVFDFVVDYVLSLSSRLEAVGYFELPPVSLC